ncbi:hypothetical protein [Sphingomonas sediminicola]|nr:hypothetical protein [Sphingomonas sediminicola]
MRNVPNDRTKPTLLEIAKTKSALGIALIAIALLAWAAGLIRL